MWANAKTADGGLETGDYSCHYTARRRAVSQPIVDANAIVAKTTEMKSDLPWNGWPRNISITSGKAAASE